MTPVLPMCVGGAIAAVTLSSLYHRKPSLRLAIAINCTVSALFGILMTHHHTHHPTALALASGFLATAAPLTSLFLRRPTIETVPEAIQFAGRIGRLLALNLLYGVAFAMAGFLAVVLTATPKF
jgi:hypothetical protein